MTAPATMIPATMTVVRLYDVDDVRLESAPVPSIGPREALVRTAACGICSGDVMPWYIRRKAPLVFGHEPSGVIAAVGPEVTGFQVGDRVFVHHHAPCMTCRHCQRGAYSMCDAWRASAIDPGGMAEYFRVPELNLTDTLRLPDPVGFEDGALVEPAACAVKALRRANIRPGDAVLVIGLGVMGQLLARLARSFGAGQVLGAEFVAERRAWALRLGADAVFDPNAAAQGGNSPGAAGRDGLAAQVRDFTGGRGADVVIVGPPTVMAMRSGIACASKGGTVVMFSPAPPGEALEIEPHDLYFREVNLVPSYSCGPDDTREALRLISSGAVRAADVVSHRYPLREAPRAYADMLLGGDVLKAMVNFE